MVLAAYATVTTNSANRAINFRQISLDPVHVLFPGLTCGIS